MSSCLCGGDGDFTLHSLYSLIAHSSSRYFGEPLTTLSNICQEADGGIIMSHIKHNLTGIITAVPRINSILLSVVKLTSHNLISCFSGCHSVNYHEKHTWIMKWRAKPQFDDERFQLWYVPSKIFSNSCSSRGELGSRLSLCWQAAFHTGWTH